MALIDPVTGLLIPMRESEEGQYIPVAPGEAPAATATPATGSAPAPTATPAPAPAPAPDVPHKPAPSPSPSPCTTLGPAATAAATACTTADSSASAPAVKAPERPPPEPTAPALASLPTQAPATTTATAAVLAPAPAPAQAPAAVVPVRASPPVHRVPLPQPPSPAIQPLAAAAPALHPHPHPEAGSAGLSAPPWPAQQSHVPVIAAPSVLAVAAQGARSGPVKTPAGPARPMTTLKAHVLTQAAKASPTLLHPPPPPGAALKSPVIKSTAAPTLGSSVVATKPREVIQTPLQQHQSPPQPPLTLSVAKSVSSAVPMTPKAHILQAVSKVNVPAAAHQLPSVSVTKVHHVMPPHQQSVVNMKAAAQTPLNPKAHLLQAATKAAVQVQLGAKGLPPAAHQGPAQAASPPLPLALPLPQPPKAHHQPLAGKPILTGAVASPPLKPPHLASQPPVIPSGVPAHLSSHVKGLMEPPKVEVTIGGCIVVPTPSPQSRPQVLQAGLPVPAYEASLGGDVVHGHMGFQSAAAAVAAAAHGGHGAHGAHARRRRRRQRRPGGRTALRQRPARPPHYVHPHAAHAAHAAHVYQHYLRSHISPYSLPPVRSPMLPGMELKADGDAEEVAARGSSSPPLELRRTAVEAGAATAGPVPGAPVSATAAGQRYPVMWQGLLALKNDQAAVQMHFVFGNPHVARDSLPCNSDGSTPPLRIAQRMRLEQTQVEGVARKMQMDNEHCMLLALPCGRDHMDVLQQSNNLQTGFITYLQQKQAAGIVNIAAPGSQQAAYVVHIFPSCDFANENLARIAPDLLHRVADLAHLLIIIATV
ncbi:Uncharacterized protein GBIM_04752 [Gryllus bimaculatus]|nr:Uncharacterized protein GBIM_04752 [Gryllus bimaculatus]